MDSKQNMTNRKKLIEVALPLDAINSASAREKSIRHGHPSTLHLWWARRPLATARAVIFAQMVDDPSSRPELFPTEEAQEKERRRLFGIIEELVTWENTTNKRGNCAVPGFRVVERTLPTSTMQGVPPVGADSVRSGGGRPRWRTPGAE